MKVCPNCCYINLDKNPECSKCGAILEGAPDVKWNDFKRAGEIQKELRANAQVFGKFTKPAAPPLNQERKSEEPPVCPLTQTIVIQPTKRELKMEAKMELQERIKQMDKEGIAYCPKCYSTSLSANKKGFGIGKAVVGAALTASPIGLVAGNLGAKKVRITCLKCGHEFWAGKK